jgi:hypothetical protein
MTPGLADVRFAPLTDVWSGHVEGVAPHADDPGSNEDKKRHRPRGQKIHATRILGFHSGCCNRGCQKWPLPPRG